MTEITKAEFIRKMTNNDSVQIGISPACTENEIKACKSRIKEMHYAKRTASARNLHITFSNNSNLYLNNTENTEIKCYEDDNVLIVENKSIIKYYGFDDEVVTKYLYYAIV